MESDSITHANGNGHAADPYNLDELEELNPEPVRFTVKGRTLLINELPHKEYVVAQKQMATLQATVRGLRGADDVGENFVERLDVDERGLLMRLFGPFNEWLAELDEEDLRSRHAEWDQLDPNARGPEPRREVGVFFAGLTERKLARLTATAFEVQQRFVEAEERRAREAGVDTTPFERALSSGGSSTSASASGSS